MNIRSKTVVLGLPKHMNGDLGERAQISIMFKEMLEKEVPGLNVVLIDERLTTKVAQDQLILLMFLERNGSR